MMETGLIIATLIIFSVGVMAVLVGFDFIIHAILTKKKT